MGEYEIDLEKIKWGPGDVREEEPRDRSVGRDLGNRVNVRIKRSGPLVGDTWRIGREGTTVLMSTKSGCRVACRPPDPVYLLGLSRC